MGRPPADRRTRRRLAGSDPRSPDCRADRPCRTPVRRRAAAVLAARLLDGDSHALDDGTRLSGLVLPALAVLYATDMPDSAEARCVLWSRAGAADDQLSATVPAVGLRLDGGVPVARVSRICAEAGHPVGPDPGRLTPAPWGRALVDLIAELRTAVVEEPAADADQGRADRPQVRHRAGQ